MKERVIMASVKIASGGSVSGTPIGSPAQPLGRRRNPPVRAISTTPIVTAPASAPTQTPTLKTIIEDLLKTTSSSTDTLASYTHIQNILKNNPSDLKSEIKSLAHFPLFKDFFKDEDNIQFLITCFTDSKELDPTVIRLKGNQTGCFKLPQYFLARLIKDHDNSTDINKNIKNFMDMLVYVLTGKGPVERDITASIHSSRTHSLDTMIHILSSLENQPYLTGLPATPILNTFKELFLNPDYTFLDILGYIKRCSDRQSTFNSKMTGGMSFNIMIEIPANGSQPAFVVYAHTHQRTVAKDSKVVRFSGKPTISAHELPRDTGHFLMNPFILDPATQKEIAQTTTVTLLNAQVLSLPDHSGDYRSETIDGKDLVISAKADLLDSTKNNVLKLRNTLLKSLYQILNSAELKALIEAIKKLKLEARHNNFTDNFILNVKDEKIPEIDLKVVTNGAGQQTITVIDKMISLLSVLEDIPTNLEQPQHASKREAIFKALSQMHEIFSTEFCSFHSSKLSKRDKTTLKNDINNNLFKGDKKDTTYQKALYDLLVKMISTKMAFQNQHFTKTDSDQLPAIFNSIALRLQFYNNTRKESHLMMNSDGTTIYKPEISTLLKKRVQALPKTPAPASKPAPPSRATTSPFTPPASPDSNLSAVAGPASRSKSTSGTKANPLSPPYSPDSNLSAAAAPAKSPSLTRKYAFDALYRHKRLPGEGTISAPSSPERAKQSSRVRTISENQQATPFCSGRLRYQQAQLANRSPRQALNMLSANGELVDPQAFLNLSQPPRAASFPG